MLAPVIPGVLEPARQYVMAFVVHMVVSSFMYAWTLLLPISQGTLVDSSVYANMASFYYIIKVRRRGIIPGAGWIAEAGTANALCTQANSAQHVRWKTHEEGERVEFKRVSGLTGMHMVLLTWELVGLT